MAAMLMRKTALAPCQSRVKPFVSVSRPVVRAKATQQDDVDFDITAVARVADAVMEQYTVEQLVDDAAQVSEEVVDHIEEALEGARGNLPANLQMAAAAIAGTVEAAELEDVEDVQSGAGFRRYDEQEDAVMGDALAAVTPFKLTRQELSNLVPADWANTNVDWFSNKKDAAVPLPEYKLAFLWQDTNIAVAVDQVYSRGQTSPLTEYFFWPRKDAWEELKAALEARPWVAERDKVILLNRLTEVINFWQQEDVKHTVDEARSAFPDCAFA